MRLAHPLAELLAVADPGRIPVFLHPRAEIVGADPAGVEFGEEGEELFGFLLVGWGGLDGVGGGEGVEEGPGAAAELVDVWGAVGRGLVKGGGRGGWSRDRGLLLRGSG